MPLASQDVCLYLSYSNPLQYRSIIVKIGTIMSYRVFFLKSYQGGSSTYQNSPFFTQLISIHNYQLPIYLFAGRPNA